MPLIDASELLLDADFVGTIPVTRLAETVGDNGLAQFTPSSFDIFGTTLPADPESLQLLPDGARTDGAISIITRTHLLGATETNAPDTLVSEGNTYTVAHVKRYTKYGAGFLEAICTLKDLSGPAS
jgi:galactose-6-phosphate isomerase